MQFDQHPAFEIRDPFATVTSGAKILELDLAACISAETEHYTNT